MQSFAVATAFAILACSAQGTPDSSSDQGTPGAGGMISAGGSLASNGGRSTNVGAGGSGAGGSGGHSAMGGAFSGAGAGGSGAGGRANGGAGGKASGGAPGMAGASSSTGGAAPLDCNAAMPTEGGTKHTGLGQGGKDNLAWQLWANTASNGSITTFSTPAFSADWNNAGDYLARIGFEWGNAGKAYDTYGTITAQYAYKKTGTGGGYSYIGIYGWSTNPCVEWYIVDDSFNKMPVNPGNTTNKGTVTIDDGDYILYTRQTTGTGGSRCNASSWAQYYSVRKTARQCGTISITQHFDAWKAASMPLGNLLEAKILVEVGGGNGSVDFPVANVALAK
ncbi:MAG: glycoside hydrolase family 11 protein [Pseudomonadota bacterium]